MVYAIDARGLRPPASLTAETGRTVTGPLSIESPRADRDAAEGSDALVTETGGFTRRYTNDLADALARIAAESRNYYLLGFPPARAPDGKPSSTCRRACTSPASSCVRPEVIVGGP